MAKLLCFVIEKPMNIFQLKDVVIPDADTGSFLFSVLIAVLFYMKYRQLEIECEREEMIEHFLD
jgi:hypothetical protein